MSAQYLQQQNVLGIYSHRIQCWAVGHDSILPPLMYTGKMTVLPLHATVELELELELDSAVHVTVLNASAQDLQAPAQPIGSIVLMSYKGLFLQ